MKLITLFAALILLGCTPNQNKKEVQVLAVISSPDTSKAFVKGNVTDKNIEKVNLLCSKWTLSKMYMIDKDGAKTEFNQGPMTLELKQDHTATSEMKSMNMTSTSTWEVDSLCTSFELTSVTLNNEKPEKTYRQTNKIIALDKNELKYTYADPLSGMTLLFEYKHE